MVKVTSAVVALTVLAFSVAPAEAQCCGWWQRWFGRPATTAYYAPYMASYAPAGYGQVVNYVPQTSYRTIYMNAPVVAYSPVTACNPCGGATTVLRPVTSYAVQPRLVPYTTFRPVVVPTVPACGCAAPTAVAPVTATPAYYAPSAPAVSGYAPAPATISAPLSLGTPGTTVRSLAPSPTYPSGPASTSTPSLVPEAQPEPADSAPANKTFEDQNKPNSTTPNQQPQSRILFPSRPESSNSNTSGVPRTLDPEDQDRSTALPIRQAWAVRQASLVSPAMPATQKLDDSGWRAARH
ncbi:MAG: hypothetical protein HY288_18360 [Planctomycetia bacterium]|nr:hypothetical protein [Planctomycetia bacterium]